MNSMKEIKIEKITFNIGAGTDQEKLKKGMKLLKNLTGIEPVKTITQKRIPGWSLRPGLPIGCKITIRGKTAEELLKRLFAAKENKLKKSSIDNRGNISFGIPEYIDIPELNYDPSIGIMGLEVSVTMVRPGYSVSKRRILTSTIGKKHIITAHEIIEFLKEKFNVIVEGK